MVRLIISSYLWAIVMTLCVWDYCVLKFPPCHLPRVYQEVLMPVVKVRAGNSTGSGVVISLEQRAKSIYVLTAAHVVGNQNKVQVHIYDYALGVVTIKSANVIITDTNKDLALLTFTSKDRLHPLVKGLRCAKLADRNYKPQLFTPVYAVGCSLGYNPRPSEGIITVVGPDASVGISSSPRPRHIEISAPILPGNSGGGVFLKDTHELIGIAVWVRTYHGQLVTTMCGVVPIQQVYKFLEECDAAIPLRAGLRCRSVYEFLNNNRITPRGSWGGFSSLVRPGFRVRNRNKGARLANTTYERG